MQSKEVTQHLDVRQYTVHCSSLITETAFRDQRSVSPTSRISQRLETV